MNVKVARLVGTANLTLGNSDGDETEARLAVENEAAEIGATQAELDEALVEAELI